MTTSAGTERGVRLPGAAGTARVAWRRALVAAVLLRLAVAVVTVAAPQVVGDAGAVAVAAQDGFTGWVAAPADGLDLVGAGLERQDALWYLAIAADGYPTTDDVPQAAAFLPGTPALVAAVGWLVGGRLLLAAHLVALATTVVALAGVHELARDAATRWRPSASGAVDADATARRAVLLLASFPTSFFLVAPYSEGPFLAVTAWALVLAGRGRAVVPGVLGLLAGTLRPLGVVLAVPLALRGHGAPPRRLAAAAGPLLGTAAVAAGAWLRWGRPDAVVAAQAAWQRAPQWPWTTLLDATRLAVDLGSWWLLDWLVVVPVLAAVGWLVRRDRVLGAYALAHVVVWFLAPFPDRPLLSLPRFAVALAPLPVVLAAWTRRRGVLVVALVAQAALWVVHLAAFTTWRPVF